MGGGWRHESGFGASAVETARWLKATARHEQARLAARARPLPSDVELRLRPASEIPDPERKELVGWLADSFSWTERYADFDWHLEAVSGRERLAHLGLVRRNVRVVDRQLDTALVGGVLTEKRWRRRGLASVLMRSADSFVTQALGLRFGLLLCAEALVPLYEGLGWNRLRSPLVYQQPDRYRLRAGPAMLKCYSGAPWPPGPVDLQGLPV
ncbi:MAG TPA: GNAT family N-acetyltransferase [Gaiella sp.]|nr:GNAT family N-acetyltransferase [Gaiella sp.]